MIETISDAKYLTFSWINPNPCPPCGENCPLFDFWQEESDLT
jgi:hypothetical protein